MSGLRLASLLGVLTLLAACGGSGSSAVVADESLLNVSSTGASSVNYNLWYLIDTLPYEPLNTVELDAVTFMREEEKLARDVYMSLYDIWGAKIFTNISDSEQTHTDAVLRLIQKYDLADPAQDALRGVFSNPALQGLYDTLIALGSASLLDAYIVGATIEDLDIYDLRRLSVEIDNQDITVVFDSLELGSRNHMRAFSARLADLGMVYMPVYISQEEYDAIINSPKETG
jgi:hypothetical protein